MAIYTTNDWSGATTYNLNAIVKYNSFYYYSLTNNNLSNTPDVSPNSWGGITSYVGITKPQFIWKPSYNTNVNSEPLVKKVQLGDGYEQRIPDGIDTDLIKVELVFDLRSSDEAAAIDHFLHKRRGAESFVFTAPPPYDTPKLFVARAWTSTFVFFNNYTIRFVAEERVN